MRSEWSYRTRCPLHMDAPCPGDCDYWSKSDAMKAKVAAGICCRMNCNNPATVGQVCAPCSEIVHRLANFAVLKFT